MCKYTCECSCLCVNMYYILTCNIVLCNNWLSTCRIGNCKINIFRLEKTNFNELSYCIEYRGLKSKTMGNVYVSISIWKFKKKTKKTTCNIKMP